MRGAGLLVGLLPVLLGAGGESSGDGRRTTVLALVLLVGAAYLLAHFVVDWLQRRFLFVSGVEYLVIGLGLGYLDAFRDLTPLAPIIALAAGWVGLVYAMELDLRRLLDLKSGAVRLALFKSVISGGLVAWGAHAMLVSGWFGPVNPDNAWMAAGVMGCAGAAGSSSGIDLISKRYGNEGSHLQLLRSASAIGDLVSILAFGLLFCLFHRGETLGDVAPSPSDWAWLTVGIGLSLGVLFTVFLGDDESDASRFLGMVGVVAFASGAAFFLNLSLLTVNLLLGLVVANSRRDGPGIATTLAGTRGPMSLVLSVFAGALWTAPWPTSGSIAEIAVGVVPVAALTFLYIALRFVGKWMGSVVAAQGTGLRPDLARGLLAQGDEALAMAISFRLVYEGPAVDVAYTAILGAVILHELFAPRLLKGLLVDAGEIRTEAQLSG